MRPAKAALRVRTTDSAHAHPIAPNRLATLPVPTKPNRVWVSDLTCVPTDEGWLYVAGVLDRCSRCLVGWAMGSTLDTAVPLAALMMALRNPGRYCSVSAFAPIVAPSQCPWGRKVFGHYLGDDEQAWQQYDAVVLLRQARQQLPMLVDQGEADTFLSEQLQPGLLLQAGRDCNYPILYRSRPGYDHSYYFIATFIEEHLRFHAAHLAVAD